MIKYKIYIYIAVVVLCAGLAGIAVLKHKVAIHHESDPVANGLIQLQSPINVKQINVINGDEFDLLLNDGRRIHAVLDVRAVPGAKNKVVSFINRCYNPRIIIQEKKDSVWIVSMFVTTKGVDGENVEVSLAKWLSEKKLAYD